MRHFIMKAILRRAARFALGRRSLLPPSRRAIFAYHDVSSVTAPQHSKHYSTRPATFERHLDLLQREFHVVTLDEIVRPEIPAGKHSRPLVALTFDDGFLSVLECAKPILDARGLPFALFLNGRAMRDDGLDYLAAYAPPPHPPGTRFYLRPDEVAALARAGVTIGNHTTDHRLLVGQTARDLDEVIDANKAYLESIVGAPVRHLALPYGKKEHYDQQALARCFASGHEYVYSTNPTVFTASTTSTFRRAPVPRIGITDNPTSELLFFLNRPLLRPMDL